MSDISVVEESPNAYEFIGFPVGPACRRKMSEEERKRRQAAACKKYQSTHSEEIARRRLAYRDPSLPLDEIEGGGFRCRICKGIIGSHKAFGVHERSNKHQRSIGNAGSSSSTSGGSDNDP